MTIGSLWLVPNTLDHGADPVDLQEVLPLGVLRRAAALAHWAAEDARSTRAFLKRVGEVVPLARPLQEISITEMPRPPKGRHDPVPEGRWRELLAPALAGEDLGLISEAGMPAVADPGARLVAVAHAAGVPVETMSGPSSLVMALAASGLEGQSFAFVGYLPQEAGARTARIRELEALSRRLGQTQMFIETPYRNGAMLAALLATLAPSTRLAVSCGLTLTGGFTRSADVSAWRAQARALPDRVPAVFAILGR